MKAARVLNGELGIHDVDAPIPGVDQALLRITASGVCHSDLHLARGDWYGMQPPSLGHEAIGIVEDARTRRRPVREGRRSCDRRSRWQRRRVLVRRVRVLPPRPAPALRADAERHGHVRRAVRACTRRARGPARQHPRHRGAARLRRPHRVRRGEEGAEARRDAGADGRRHRRGRRPRPLRRAAADRVRIPRRRGRHRRGASRLRALARRRARGRARQRRRGRAARARRRRRRRSCSRRGSPATTSACNSCARRGLFVGVGLPPTSEGGFYDRRVPPVRRSSRRSSSPRSATCRTCASSSISLPAARCGRTSTAPARCPTSTRSSRSSRPASSSDVR